MSPAKYAANAANAQLSTGPKTDEGKARSSQNSFKHGLTSSKLIVSPELQSEFDEFRQTLLDETKPTAGLEMITFNLLLRAAWQLERCRQNEATIDDPFSKEADKIARYAAPAERSYYRALKELRELQTERAWRSAKLTPEQNKAMPVLVRVSKMKKRTQMDEVGDSINRLAMQAKIEDKYFDARLKALGA